MPAKITKKPARKSAARKSAAKHHNGVPPRKSKAAEAEALRAEASRLQALIQESTDRSAALERELADARASGARTGELEQELRETHARLTTQRAELEAARVESQNLRDEVIKARSIPPPPRQGCPKCSAPMSDYQLGEVRARRCQACQGIFFESGELEKMLKNHDEQLQSGKKGFFSGLFGKK